MIAGRLIGYDPRLVNDILNPLPHTPSGSAWGQTSFSVEWLRNGVVVEKETSAVANVADAVAAARARADVVVAHRPREEPDTFRLIDPSGAVLITFKFLTKRL
jgi:hypothetical protein